MILISKKKTLLVFNVDFDINQSIKDFNKEKWTWENVAHHHKHCTK